MMQDAISYVLENVDMNEVRHIGYEMDKYRCPANMVDHSFMVNDIYEYLNEFAEEHGLSEDFWTEDYDDDELVMMLIDADNEQQQASEQFFAMQEKVMASIKSAAFQRALNFIADRDWAFYMELIKQEYEDINN